MKQEKGEALDSGGGSCVMFHVQGCKLHETITDLEMPAEGMLPVHSPHELAPELLILIKGRNISTRTNEEHKVTPPESFSVSVPIWWREEMDWRKG